MSLKNLYLTIPVGQSVRDFLILGTVERLVDLLPDFRVVLLSPSYNVPEFLEQCPKHDRIVVRRMELPVGGRNWRLIHWRRKFHHRRLTSLMLRWEARRTQLPGYLSRTFDEFPPIAVVSTHPMLYHDYEVVTWARRLGIQTLGVVKSWDNIQKGLSSHCHLLSVWNPVNREEAIRLLHYRHDEVTMNGALSFDAYYHPAFDMAREEALSSLGLDPSQRLITLATCGVLDKEFYGRDETHLVDDLIRMIDASPTLKGTQLLIRLHPTSHLECFRKYWNRSNIKISFASVLPGTGWCPNRHDLQEQTNLLRHSDVVVTPGSSWALEAALHDTPTVVPVYSDLQPDHAAAQFQRWTLARHFKRLVDNSWVPVTRSYAETLTAIEEACVNPGKFDKGRQAIVDQYAYYRDCGSSARVAQWIADVAQAARPGAPRGY